VKRPSLGAGAGCVAWIGRAFAACDHASNRLPRGLLVQNLSYEVFLNTP